MFITLTHQNGNPDYGEMNYTKYMVKFSNLAMAHDMLLYRINIALYSFILKLVPSIEKKHKTQKNCYLATKVFILINKTFKFYCTGKRETGHDPRQGTF